MPSKKNSTKKDKKHSPQSLFHSALLPVIGTLIVSVVVLLAYIGLYEKNQGLAEQQSRLDANAALIAQQFNHGLHLLEYGLAGLAAESELINAVAEHNAEQIKGLENRYAKRLPYQLGIRIIPAGTATLDRDSFPPITFTAIDNIQKAENGQLVPAEVQVVAAKNILYWTRPIQDDTKHTVGTLLVFIDFAELMKESMPAPAPDSLRQVIQKMGKETPKTVFSQGDAQLSEQGTRSEQNTSNPQWSILVAQTPDSIGKQLMGLLVLPVLMLLAGIGVVFVTLRILENRLRADGAALLLHIEELKFGQYSKQPTFNLLFMETLSYTVERLFSQSEAEPPVHLSKPVKEETNETQSIDQVIASVSAQQNIAPTSPASPPKETKITAQSNVKPDKAFAADKLPSVTVDENVSLPNLPSHIFRAYDIRGIAHQELSVETLRLLGQAIGSEALDKGERGIFVGQDGRLSSPALCEALIGGLLSTGIHVTDIGSVPTPVLWFACHTLESRSGVMVTGSHNPADYNGLKIMIAGETLSGEKILHLKKRLLNQSLRQGKGVQSQMDISEQYIQHICEDVILATPMTVVIDSGNGITGPIAARLFNELGCTVIPLFGEVDGNFPNHHPDPSQEKNLLQLKQALKEHKANLGLAFDGDGDRIGVVLPSGKTIWPDRLMMLYAKDLLVRNPGADIIFDVKCTRRLPELITSLGGRPLMWKTGHSLIKAKLKEMKAALAGEMSGHIFFNDRWFGFDDALYCGARLLEILSTESDSPEAIFAALPDSLSTPELLIPVPEDKKFHIIKELEKNGQFGAGKITTIDGIRVDFPKAWGLVRASNTTPALTARFEGLNEEALEQIQALFQKQLQAIDGNLKIPSAG